MPKVGNFEHLDDPGWWLECGALPFLTIVAGAVLSVVASTGGRLVTVAKSLADVWADLVLAGVVNLVTVAMAVAGVSRTGVVAPRVIQAIGMTDRPWWVFMLFAVLIGVLGLPLAFVARRTWDPAGHPMPTVSQFKRWLCLTFAGSVVFLSSVAAAGRFRGFL